MRRSLAVTAFAATICAGSAAAQDWRLAISEAFDTPSGWTVGRNSAGGCLAAAMYKDETTVWMGFDPKGQTVMALTNPKWRSIEVGKEYKVLLRLNRSRWNGVFGGFERDGEKGLINIGIKAEFLNEVAAASGVFVEYDGEVIARLTLRGSRAALRSATSCQRQFAGAGSGASSGSSSPGPTPKSPDGWVTGTGFYVTSDGHVLTNEHVIENCKREVYVQPAGGTRISASVVAKDGRNDLALLRTSHKPKRIPAFNLNAKLGEQVFVYGFPEPGFLASTGNFTIGNITAMAGLLDNTAHIQVSAPVHGGNSGGPLKDRYGNVVGVIVAKMRGDYQTVNFAIKPHIAIGFLSSNSVSPQMQIVDAPLEPTTIAEQAKEFTVQVICR